jgi:hypothetical protein
MKIPEKTQVYYTTDGSDPTTESTPYNGERLELNFTTVLRAKGFSDDPSIQPSETITGTYLINAYHTTLFPKPLFLKFGYRISRYHYGIHYSNF